jgi:hypothetical protein
MVSLQQAVETCRDVEDPTVGRPAGRALPSEVSSGTHFC